MAGAVRSLMAPLMAPLIAGALATLGGCATVDPFAVAPIAAHLQRADAVGDCARRLLADDAAIRAAAARDAQDVVVPGFPYLRVDRLGEATAPPADDAAAWPPWRERLAAVDRQARAIERRNAGLDIGTGARAGAGIDAGAEADAVTETGPGIAGAADPDLRCRRLLQAADDTSDARAALRRAARVPDDYVTAWRAIGLYPLTRLGFAAGIRSWHAATRATFAVPRDALPVEGRLLRVAPAADAAAGLTAVAGSASSRPPPVVAGAAAPPVDDLPALRALLQRHAPVLEVDVSGPHDRIGALVIAGDRVLVDADTDADAAPVAYVRLAHGLLGGVLRRQLVYSFWFPRRPKAHALDLLGGELDAIVWRVTIDDDGHALVYDSIHACGCYHLFFATDRVRPRAAPPPGQGPLDEGLFMPQPLAPQPPLVLRVQSRTHYLQRVDRDPPTGGTAAAGSPLAPAALPAARHYRLLDEDRLRSLPITGGAAGGPRHRSVYDPRGLIPGSERLERFLFWPMGIASAGQMRQWGRQPTAFVGRRHFDDPGLLERYFELQPTDPDGVPPH